MLSRAVGKQDQETVDKIMGNLIAMDLILGIMITAAGMIFTRQILTLSGAEGEILNNAEHYLRIIFAGGLFVNFAQSSNMIMRGEGILKQAMVFSAGGGPFLVYQGCRPREPGCTAFPDFVQRLCFAGLFHHGDHADAVPGEGRSIKSWSKRYRACSSV